MRYWQEFRQQRDLQQERIFEALRPRHLPSRQRCMYVWDDRHAFEVDARRMGVVPSKQALIGIQPVDGKHTVHRARIDALNILNNVPPEQIAARAKDYWAGVANPESGTEVLLVGSFEVVRHGR